MLNFLFQGLFELLAGAVEAVLDMMIEAFSVDLHGFTNVFPIMSTFLDIFSAIGWSFLILLMVLSVMRSILDPNSQQAEHPLSILGRTILAGGVLACSGQITEMFLTWGNKIYEVFNGVDPSVVAGTTFGHQVKNVFSVGASAAIGATTGGVTLVIQLVLLSVLFVEIVKFLLEALTRYVTLCFGTFIAPLVAPTIISKATSGIFTSYLSFVFGQTVLLWMSTVFMKIIVSGFYAFGNDTGAWFFFKYFLLLGVVKLAQQADNILVKLGFKTVRQSGVGLLGTLGGAAMLASRSMGMGSMLKNSLAGKGVGKALNKGKEALSTARGPRSGAGGRPGEMIPKFRPQGGASEAAGFAGGAGAAAGAAAKVARPSPEAVARAGLMEKQAKAQSERTAQEDVKKGLDDKSKKPETDQNETSEKLGEVQTASPVGGNGQPIVEGALQDDGTDPDVGSMTGREVADHFATDVMPDNLSGDPALAPRATGGDGRTATPNVQASSLQPRSSAALETGIRSYASLVSKGEMTCSEVARANTGFTLSESGHWTYTNPNVEGAPTIHGHLDSHEMLPAEELSSRISSCQAQSAEFTQLAAAPELSPALQSCYSSLASAEAANAQQMQCIQAHDYRGASEARSNAHQSVREAGKYYQSCSPQERVTLSQYGLTGGGTGCTYSSHGDTSFRVASGKGGRGGGQGSDGVRKSGGFSGGGKGQARSAPRKP